MNKERALDRRRPVNQTSARPPKEEQLEPRTENCVAESEKAFSTSTLRDDTMSELTEKDIVEGYIKWAKANAIPIMECEVEDIEEYMMRFLKAAG